MQSPEESPDYTEAEFPKNWPNEARVRTINMYLNDSTVHSVELFRRGAKIIVRVWRIDHMALHRA